MPRRTTRIGGRDVPVEDGDMITVSFSGGAGGSSEAGDYEFWTVFSKIGIDTARCRPGADPGERWRKMEGSSEPAYVKGWEIARTADVIRPANQARVIKWLTGHDDSDAPFAGDCTVGDRAMRVVREDGTYRFEDRS
jgi:hypothetical protein